MGCINGCAPNTTGCVGAQVSSCQLGGDGCFHWTLPTNCGPGLQCMGNACQVIETPSNTVTVAMSYPFLFRGYAVDEFPSYLVHLMGTTIARNPAEISTSLACFQLVNHSTTHAWNLQLLASVPGWSTQAAHVLTLPANTVLNGCLNPAMNQPALQAITVATSAVVNVEVRDPSAGTLVFGENHNVRLQGGNSVYWTGNNSADLRPYAAVMSMPNNADVVGTLNFVASHSRLEGGWGGNPYANVGHYFLPTTSSLDVGFYAQAISYLEPGETLGAVMTSIIGGDGWADLRIFNSTEYERYRTGLSSIAEISTNSTFNTIFFTNNGTTGGYFYVVASNPSYNLGPRDITWTYSATRAGVAWDVLASIFHDLRLRGISFAGLPAGYFSSKEWVRWPGDSLHYTGANVMDATVLISSIAEGLGVDPLIITVPGHSYVGIHARASNQAPGTGTIWPLETMMVGDNSKGYLDAIFCGVSNCVVPNPAFINRQDVRTLRSQGITPIPR